MILFFVVPWELFDLEHTKLQQPVKRLHIRVLDNIPSFPLLRCDY